MIRRLATPPSGWNGRLPAAPPGAIDVNVVDGKLAAYWDDDHPSAMSAQAWTAFVAGATYTPPVEETNEATIRQQAVQALAANKTFVAIAAPTNAQNAAQIKALSRQMNGVIRLLLGQLDATD